MCIIPSKKVIKGKLENIKGSGFFLYIINQDIPFNKCLITNNHILDEKDIELNNNVYIIYLNETKVIRINEKRNVYTDINLDYILKVKNYHFQMVK